MYQSRSKKMFAFALLLVMALGATFTMNATPASHELFAAQQQAVVGGSACEFALGVSAGLGIASLFGCLACGVAAIVIDVGAVIAC